VEFDDIFGSSSTFGEEPEIGLQEVNTVVNAEERPESRAMGSGRQRRNLSEIQTQEEEKACTLEIACLVQDCR
jgi:hypothetical protein